MKKSLICLCLVLCQMLCLVLGACHPSPTPDGSPTGQDDTTAETETNTETKTETETDDGRVTVEIVCPIEGAAVFEGGALVQDVTDKPFEPVSFSLKRGYVYQGYEIDGTLYPGTTIALENVTADTRVTLRLDYVTRELPIVHLTTQSPIENKYDYVDVTFDLVNTQDEAHDVGGRIRLRGQSTSTYEKKPYRIKFNQKISLFGSHKAKDWVLLADYLDPSCLRNYTAFYLGAASDALAFTPTIHHVNLYLNGEFMGLYSLCEQVEEDEGRLDIEQVITPDMTDLDDFNFYVCLDEYAPHEPGAIEGETYFYVAWCGKYFSLKYPQKADFCSDEQFYSFFTQLEKRYNRILEACRDGNTRKMKAYMDVDSLIDHMIIDQIMGERDHVWKSFYSYQIAGEKLRFGPIWDYDYSLYVPWTNAPNEYYTVDTKIEYSNEFFRGVARSDELYSLLCERYQSHWHDVLSDCIMHVQRYENGISESLELNRALWYGDKPDIADDNCDFLIKFLQSRRRVLKQEWR